MVKRVSEEKRFWDKVMPEPNSGCFLWTGCTDGNYGLFNSHEKAHRASWRLAKQKPVPKGMVIMHTCDVKICVNPDHL